jgi:hypothetical protein
MRWLSFLQRAVRASVGPSAGAAAGAAAGVASPVLGAAAAAAAQNVAEQLLCEFLPAQQDALDALAERTGALQVLLGGVQFDVQSLLNAPWETALLHIHDASKHPGDAREDLLLARNSLYQAWAAAAGSAGRRAMVAQELSVVYALLGRRGDSADWLFRSYREAEENADTTVGLVGAVLESVPREARKREEPIPPHVLLLHRAGTRRGAPEPSMCALRISCRRCGRWPTPRTSCSAFGWPVQRRGCPSRSRPFTCSFMSATA